MLLSKVNGQPIGRWTMGVSGSVDYFIQTLIDNQRFDIDSTFELGISDEQYLELRNQLDQPHVPGISFGVHGGYRINHRLDLETGLRLVGAGTQVEVSDITNFELLNIFGPENIGKKVVNAYQILEIPLVIKQRLGRTNKMDLSKRKTGTRLFNMYRHLFVSYGLGVGFPVAQDEFYNRIEHFGITGNMGLAGLLGFGFHMDTRSPFFLNVRAQLRANLLSYYQYAPLKSHYHAVGAQIVLGYRFPYETKEPKNRKPTDCASFTDAPDVSSRPKIVLGMKYGAQANFLLGTDVSNPFLGLRGTVPATEFNVETASGDYQTTFTPNIGLHFEYLFHPYFSLGASPVYNSRGFKSEHTFFMDDLRTIKTRQRVYINYIDLPIRLIFYPSPKFFAFAGPIISIAASNRLFEYWQVFDENITFPELNATSAEEVKVSNYYGSSPDGFTLGFEFGGGAHIDEAFSVSAQVGFYEGIFQKGNGRPSLWNTTMSISAYYFFLKR